MSCLLVRAALVGFLSLSLAGDSLAAERSQPTVKGGDYNPDHRVVELFAAVEAGEIEARVILKDARSGRLFLENKTREPINVRLPDAFAAVLKQGFLNFDNDNNDSSRNQQVGGGADNRQNNFDFFNVPAERVGEVKLRCVCLEHGHPEPGPRLPYEIKPLGSVSSSPELREVISKLARGECSQSTAQAAAWHLASQMSWEDLAAKEVRRLNGDRYAYFARSQLRAAMKMVETAREKIKEQASRSEKLTIKP